MQDFHKALIYMNQHWLADKKKNFREESMHDYARSLERLINKPRGN